MSTAFFTLDRDWRFTYVNAAAERILGRAATSSSARSSGTPTTTSTGTESDINYRRAMATGEPCSFEQFYPPLDAYFDVRVTPSEDGLSVYFHDITARVRAEQEREAALRRRPARRPGGCRSSAPPAPGWPGRSRSTSCCGILADVVAQRLRRRPRRRRSTSGSSATSRVVRGRPPTTPRRPSGSRALRRRAAGGRPLRHRAPRVRRRAVDAPADERLGARARAGAAADLARADARRGRRDRRGRGRARPARAGRARRAGGRRARQRGALRRRAAARAHAAALAAADGAAGRCRGSSSPRATCPGAGGRTSAATSTSATRSRTAACCS